MMMIAGLPGLQLLLDNNLFLANVYIYAHVAITHDIYIQINMHTTMLYL